MHGHVQGVTAQIANPYAGLVLEKDAEVRRAAILRRRLLHAAANLELDDSPEAILIRSTWEESPSQKESGRRREASRTAQAPSSERVEPISFWA